MTREERKLKSRIKKERRKAKRLRTAKRRKIIRRVVFLSIWGLLAAALMIGISRIMPVYKEAKEKTYDILAEMDSGTFKRESNTMIYDKDGNLIGKVGYENYEYLPIAEISDYIQMGYIDVEDKRFKTHSGVDYKALARAAWAYIRHRGAITQGGSTITQQVIKNNLLSQERTFTRKLYELLLARQIEKEYNKADIMEFYCNSNYYGNGCYGVEGAAQYYFGKSASSLSLAEAAMLVGTSNNPNNRNPESNYEKCNEKKNSVLQKMLDEGDITEEECRQAKAEQPAVKAEQTSVGSDNNQTTYAIHCAAIKLMEHDGFEFKYTFKSSEEEEAYQVRYDEAYNAAYDSIRGGGYVINTSFDSEKQSLLEKTTKDSLKNEQEKGDDGILSMQTASICIDNESGLAVAVVGGRGDNAYNRAYQARRPAGSAIKPLLDYGPAFDNGVLTPGTELRDERIDIDGYAPKNAGDVYRGRMTVREALARSTNTIAVKAYTETGPSVALDYLGKLKFGTLTFADNSNSANALGSMVNGVTVEDMAHGYATIENSGKARDNSCILEITSERDGTIYKNDDEDEVIYNQDTAFMLTDVMQGVLNEEFGTACDIYNEKQCFVGKTGTSNNRHDSWFCGYSRYFTTVTWVGYDRPKELSDDAHYASHVWSAFMNKLHKNLPKKEFLPPDTIRLADVNGSETRVEYTENIYDARPDGLDYVSSIIKEKQKEHEQQLRITKQQEEAESAVRKFEDFQIENTEDAKQLEQKHNEALFVVEEIETEEAQAPFKKRVARKYDLLSKEVADTWSLLIEEEDLHAQEETDMRNERSAQASLENAQEQIENLRIATVNLYISYFDDVKVKTDNLQTIKNYADNALMQCAEYSSYTSLSNELERAWNRAQEMPAKAELEARQREAELARQEAESVVEDAESEDERIIEATSSDS